MVTSDNEGQDAMRFSSGDKPPYRLELDLDKYGGIDLMSTSITSAASVNWIEER